MIKVEFVIYLCIDFSLLIVDDESAYSSVSQAKDDTRKSYVPRRLVIGNDEYVTPSFVAQMP